MSEPMTRAIMQQRLIEAARTDERIMGLLDYGSSSLGRADEWSDIDVSLFIRDEDCAAFKRDWKSWAAQLGELLLAYIGGVGDIMMLRAILLKSLIAGYRNILISHQEKAQSIMRPNKLITLIEEVCQVISCSICFKQNDFDHDALIEKSSLVRKTL